MQKKTSYTKQDITNLLKEEISQRKNLSIEDIDLSNRLDDFSLDSVSIVRLAGILGERLKLELEPTLLSEFNNLEKMITQLEIMHQKVIQDRVNQGKVDIDINIVASFTAEPVEEFLRYWLDKLFYYPNIQFASYNQTFQELMNPQGLLFIPQANNVMLLRIEDWFRFEQGKLEEKKAEKTLQDFVDALTAAANISDFSCTIALCPHSQAAVRKLGLSESLNQLDDQLIEVVNSLPQVDLIDARDLSRNYNIRRVFDEARDKMGHIPFSQEFFAALGTELVRRIYAKQHLPFKVIVIDCDNTLWRGVCGEDGHLSVKVAPAFAEFQRQMLAHKQKGFILCLCSKNNEADVWQVFDEHPDMLIRRKDIVSSRINWDRKSKNIIELAEELQLGLDSFVFIDDNLAECTEVRMSCPEVLVIPLPEDEDKIPGFFKNHWAFDLNQITAEDKNRSQMYQQNLERQALRTQLISFDDFLAQLNVEIDIQPLSKAEVERGSQITHRTNQFNATTIRRSQQEILDLINSKEQSIVRVQVKDRFGDYGFVGMMVYQLQKNALECETFLMSCRVLAKKVEHTMVRYLAEKAMQHKIDTVRLCFRYSDKNKPIEDFFTSLQKPFIEVAENDFKIEFSTTEVNKLLAQAKNEHQLGGKKKKLTTEDIEANISVQKKQQNNSLNDIATLAQNVEHFMQSMRSSANLKRPKLSTEYIAPRTTWQKNIAAIWCSVLGMDKVGIYDSFYELGGDSIRSAEVFARMWDLGVPESISLQTIPDPTVAGLSQAIEDVKQGKKPTLLFDQFSLEDEGDLAEDICNKGYNVSDYVTPMKSVFITGATGYIGAFILHELFVQTHDVTVTALVRASTKKEGLNRVQQNLERYGLWHDNYKSRLKVILGDLTEPLFGLDEAEFAALAKSIDTIFHSGAWVNFVYPYQHLKAANVDSVETALRLAVADKPRPIQFHFVSTLGVIMSYGYPKNVVVYEQDELAHCEGLLNGYEQSKYVGDKMVWKAIKERGIPANMYRPGMVSGLSDSGVYHKLDEFLPSFLKGCLQLKSWPLVDTTWEMVPIDYVSKAIVHIALNPKNLNRAYFSLHPKSRMVSEFIEWHQHFGYPIRALPWDIWKKELLSQGEKKLKDNALFPFVDFIRALSEEQVYFPKTDQSGFLGAIKDTGLSCPDQLILLERHTRYFIDVGYYEPPENYVPLN